SMATPWFITLEDSGDFYICTSSSASGKPIIKFNSNGTSQIWSNNEVANVKACAIDPQGMLIVVSDTTGKAVRRLSSSTGTELWSNLDVSNAKSVGIDYKNNWAYVIHYTADGNRMQRRLSCLTGTEQVSSAGISCTGPKITVSKRGEVFASYDSTITGSKTIRMLTQDLYEVWSNTVGSKASDIVVDDLGNAYCSYYLNGSDGVVRKFDEKGQVVWTNSEPNFNLLKSICFDPNGDLLCGSANGGTPKALKKINTSRKIVLV
ncbi:MAG: hypothetical protein ACRC5C_15150, partial [Bacilli bacterium]